MTRVRLDSAILAGIACAVAATAASRACAENLSFSGTGTVRVLASDWADYTGGNSTVNVGANAGGRLYWRSDVNAGDGQYIHFDLTRLQGLTILSSANVTLQNTDAQYGGGVDGSFIATANGAWTAANGAALPGATAIGDATNATGIYGSGTSITWGIGSSTFQGYVDNAASFNGLAVIGGAGSQMHFNAPLSPSLTVATSATMSAAVTVSGGAAWNSSNYSFTDGVLTINDAVAGGTSGAGDVVINSLGTVFVNGNFNKYWAMDSTRINAGGVLMSYGHSHLHNLTLAGGELAGIRPDGPNGGWTFDDATTVTGGGTSTISAQQVNLDNGTFTIDAGSTLNFTGSVRSGAITPTIGAGGRLVYGAAAGTATTLGAVSLNGGELAASSQPSAVLGNYVLGGTVTVGGSSMSTISADVRVINNEDRTFNVADADGGAGVDLLLSGKIGHYNGVSGGSATKTGGGTMKISGANELYRVTVSEGRLILEDTAIEGWWGGGLVNNAAVDFSVSGSKTVGYGISGSGSVTKSGTGTLILTGANTYSGTTSITAGTLQVGTGGTSGNLGPGAVANDGTLAFNRSDSVTITNGIAGSGGLRQVGSGTLILGGANTYTGATTIQQGTLQLLNPSIVGSASYATASGVSFVPASNDVILNASPISNVGGGSPEGTGNVATLTDGNAGIGNTFAYTVGNNQVITYQPTFLTNGYDVTGINVYSTWNDSGRDRISLDGIAYSTVDDPGMFITIPGSAVTYDPTGAPTLALAALSASGQSLATRVFQVRFNFGAQENNYVGYAQLEIVGTPSSSGGTTDVLPTASALQVASGATLDLNGVVQTVAGLAGAGSVINSAGVAAALTVAQTSTSTFGGVIGGNTSFTKSGAGRLTLTGTSDYTGLTTIEAGTLIMNGEVTATDVTVAAGALLGGSGIIGGSVDVLAGGTVAPGNSPGTLTVSGSFSLADTSGLEFELDATDTTVGGGVNDLITDVTDLLLDGQLTIVGIGDFSAVTQGTTWRLFNYSGSLTDNTLEIGTAPSLASGLSFAIDTSTANQVNLVVVPEPGGLLLAALGAATAAWPTARRLTRKQRR